MKDIAKAIALLFAIEGEGDFEILLLDPPFIHSNYGCFSICLGEIVERSKIEITPLAMKNHDNINVDYYVICFIDKQQTSESSGNTTIVPNDERFKLKWENAREFAKTISRKFNISFSRT